MLGKFIKRHPRKLIFIFLFFAVLVFTRTYNIDRTARFTQDESSDLLRIHQYFVERRITLVGPISNTNNKVFGSLTYYMLMPFAAAANFHPIGPVYGTAFWGVLTALLFLVITYQINPKKIWLVGLLMLIWYPLVETSRWAWNPHYVTFWIAAGIVAYLTKTRIGFFLAGFLTSLAFHNHYLAAGASGSFILLASVIEAHQKKWRNAILLIGGYVVPIIPFVIFDLRHPPGLFFAKYLMGGVTPDVVAVTPISFLQKSAENFMIMVKYIAAPWMSWIMAASLLVLGALEWKKHTRWLWLLPVVVQLLIGTFLIEYQTRYLLPALPFLFVWLLLPRKGTSSLLANGILWLLIISSLFTIVPQLTQTKVPPDIYSLNQASKIIETQIKERKLNNANVAALSGPDGDPLAQKYRDVLSVKNVGLKAASQYDTSEHLFVISTSDGEVVEKDTAAAMQMFSKAHLQETFLIPDSEWRVHWFMY